ncbi:hypothetical protein EXIGLDRAFT_829203 [Exidia glandulosa HHB12029]|uniref:F-box domain-containing protein n=1 Tax=Exidia glandulosa HHB12029 TaxID=1314781 RepID=A0A165PUL4_EXIGL|nr:hypothetical protein EXIGLDRAFT_829203 [Exidia glandulosa HHB12029]
MSANYTLDPDLAFTVRQRTAGVVLEGTRRARADHVPLSDFFMSVRRCFDEIMWSLARGSNLGPFPRHVRLPDEVWCMIWQDMPLVDRLRITHVCHDWRQLALGSPRVWCTVDLWFYRHDDNCACDDCALSPAPHPMISNARLVRYALTLSRSVPLCVSLGDRGSEFALGLFRTDCDAAVHLILALLQPHIDRLAALHADLFSAYVLTKFLSLIPALPRLVSLTTTSPNFNALGVPLCKSVIAMPQLRTLSMTGGWGHWLLYSRTQVFPAVTTLRVTFGWTKATLAMIRACPNLQCLELWIPQFVQDIKADRDEFVAAVAGIRHLRLLNMRQIVDFSLSDLVENKERPDYECVYTHSPSYTSHFFALDDTDSFSCSRDKDQIVFHSSAPSGRRRTFSFPFEEKVEMAPLWENFEPDALKFITCDASLWYLVAWQMPCMAHLESLTLTVSADCLLNDPPCVGDEEWPIPEYRFPALRTIVLRSTSGTEVEVPDSWWDDFVETLELEKNHRIAFRYERVTLRRDDDSETDTSESESETSESTSDTTASSSGTSDNASDAGDTDERDWSDLALLPAAWIPSQLVDPILQRGDDLEASSETEDGEPGDEEVEYDHEGFTSAYLSTLVRYQNYDF